jgi:hypothetical protein
MKTTPDQNRALVLEAFDTPFKKRNYQAAARFWSDAYIQQSTIGRPTSAMGLGRVKTLCRKSLGRGGAALRAAFAGFDYARIAAISGWMPMMFIPKGRD